MQSISASGYDIVFNEDGYSALNQKISGQHYSKIFVLTDSNSHDYCLGDFMARLETDVDTEIIEIEPGEEQKTVETCVSIWNVLIEYGADRKSLIVNLGGGVVTDLGGFVASTFKRGIDFIHVPTTLLAMVDAAIGGKNGVDLGHLKNQVGTITPPVLLLVDTAFLSTLPQNQMRSGLAEMLKHGLIFDKSYWQQFRDLSQLDFADFDSLIYRSIAIKHDITTQDPTEKGIRKALNFGHTLGHAIESHFLDDDEKTPLLHGEAIAAGMILEAFLSFKAGQLSESEYSEISGTIKSVYDTVDFSDNDIATILELLRHDKKNEYGHVLFALLDGIGRIKIDCRVGNELIVNAFQAYKS